MPQPRKTIHDKRYQVLVDCLRAARRSAKITQADLARTLRTDQSYISKYERAERRLDVIEVREICSVLGLDFLAFMELFEQALNKRPAR